MQVEDTGWYVYQILKGSHFSINHLLIIHLLLCDTIAFLGWATWSDLVSVSVMTWPEVTWNQNFSKSVEQLSKQSPEKIRTKWARVQVMKSLKGPS